MPADGPTAGGVEPDDGAVEEHELDTNTELSRAIAQLTREIHRAVVVTSPKTASEG